VLKDLSNLSSQPLITSHIHLLYQVNIISEVHVVFHILCPLIWCLLDWSSAKSCLPLSAPDLLKF